VKPHARLTDESFVARRVAQSLQRRWAGKLTVRGKQ